MDLGVGSFVFSSALVSQASKQAYSFRKMIGALVPLFALGTIRFITHLTVDYHNHTSEYGVHWNFFFTLAVITCTVNVTEMLLHSHVHLRNWNRMIVGAAFLLLQQVLLSLVHVDEYILFAERTNLFSANKEGICTILGYTSIFFFGVGFGQYIVQANTVQQVKRVAGILSGITLLVWIAHLVIDYYIVPQQEQTVQSFALPVTRASFASLTMLDRILIPSRRFLNLGYVHFVVTYNVTLLTSLFWVQTWCSNVEHESNQVLREAINKNSLAVFLIANLLTGAVNLSLDTLQISNTFANIILCGYMFVVCTVAIVFRNKTLLKF